MQNILQTKKMKKTKPRSKSISREVRIVKPYPITHTFKAGSEFDGISIVEMMSTRFPFHSKEVWQQRLENGRLGWESKKENLADDLLKAEDLIFHENPAVIEPSVPDEVEVIEESENYLLVYKPAPLPMHPGGRFNKNTLTQILLDKGFKDLKIVHRLDSVTSGLVIFSKNKEWAKKLGDAFSSGKVNKKYLALVHGVPNVDSITITSKIKRKAGFVFESGDNLKTGKNAETHFSVLERFEDFSLIDCSPITGRTHQIRLHLAEWGYPIIDDSIYGADGDSSSFSPQNVGISLMSYRLEFEDLNLHFELKEAKEKLLDLAAFPI